CLGIEQGVQRFLYGPTHHPVEVALDPLIVNRDDIVQRTRCNGLPLAGLVAFSHLQFSQISGPPALLNCAKDSVPHPVSSVCGCGAWVGAYPPHRWWRGGLWQSEFLFLNMGSNAEMGPAIQYDYYLICDINSRTAFQ